jgi:CheY-like chemotaxis protein
MSGEHCAASVGGLRVLLVEDEMMVALLLETVLNDLGHQVVGPVARLERGLEVVEREAIDLAVLDVNIDGREVYPIAAALEARGIPFIFTTGYGSDGLHPAYCDRPVLQKPYRSDDLKAAIGRVSGRSRSG